MVTRTGNVDPLGEALMSPLRGDPCVFHSVQVIDDGSKEVLTSARRGAPFVVVGADGTRTVVAPVELVFDGFVALDVTCLVGEGGPRLGAFLEAQGLRLLPERRVRLVERCVAVGGRVSAVGTLRTNVVEDPYRSPAGASEILDSSGLVLVDPVHRRRRRMVSAVKLMAFLVAAACLLAKMKEISEAKTGDCPRGMVLMDRKDDKDDWCGSTPPQCVWK